MHNRTRISLIAAVFAALVLTSGGCSLIDIIPFPGGKREIPPPIVTGYSEQGVASWYGPGFHGRQTASGERYDMYDMTCAHKVLPFGTRLRVTNLDNGRTAYLRVNDRGPFVKGRILDTSKKGAEVLGMIGPGTARVRIEVVDQAWTGQDVPGRFFVQIGSFAILANAEALKIEMDQKGYGPTRIVRASVDGKTHYRVQIGSFNGLNSARRAYARLKTEVPGSFILAD